MLFISGIIFIIIALYGFGLQELMGTLLLIWGIACIIGSILKAIMFILTDKS